MTVQAAPVAVCQQTWLGTRCAALGGRTCLWGHWDSRVINNLARMRAGNAPQRFNPDKGGTESMELSHEPIPARDGGTQFVPRWPQDHAAVDPYRRPGY